MSRIHQALLIGVLLGLAVSAEATTIQVDFEGGDAPCGFQEAAALRTLDAAPGLTFGAGAGFDGGAVLDGCANFGIVPRSGDHFLAFNRAGDYLDGGRATDPQSLGFEDSAARVSIWASGGLSETSFLMEAFGTGGTPLGSDSVIVAIGAWGLLEIDAAGIRFIRLTEIGGDNSFVFDDLSYDTVPEPATGLLIGLALVGMCYRGVASSFSIRCNVSRISR